MVGRVAKMARNSVNVDAFRTNAGADKRAIYDGPVGYFRAGSRSAITDWRGGARGRRLDGKNWYKLAGVSSKREMYDGRGRDRIPIVGWSGKHDVYVRTYFGRRIRRLPELTAAREIAIIVERLREIDVTNY